MKIRTGFVSNSSSSSFVVAIDKDKIPKTLEEFKKYYDIEWKAPILLKHIQDQLDEVLPVEKDEKIELEFGSGYLYHEAATPSERAELKAHEENFWKNSRKIKDEESDEVYRRFVGKHFQEEDKIKQKIITRVRREFVERNKGKVALYFNYSDESYEGSDLEHGGDTFRWATLNGGEVVRISHH